MKNKKFIEAESVYSVNEYKVKRVRKKLSVLNLLLIQVGICLAVSISVLAIRLISGSDVISEVGANNFFEFIST